MHNALRTLRTSTSPLWREITHTLSPRAARHAGSTDPLLPPLMILLTIVTGLVDAVAYLTLGHVFVANMTGNVVFLGFAAAGASGLSVAGSLVALTCFLGDSIVAARLAGHLDDNRLHQLRAATAIQTVLFAAALPVAALAGAHPGIDYPLIILLATAMGIQNATARRLAVADLTTTVLTQTLTGIAADSWLGGSQAATARRVLSVIAMLLGAAIGALLLLQLAPVAPLGLATGILVLVCGAAHRAARHSLR